MKNSYDRNESINIKVYHKKELRFFVHTEARCWYRKICPCFCGVTVFCYWYNFSNLGRRAQKYANAYFFLDILWSETYEYDVFRSFWTYCNGFLVAYNAYFAF